ncbi:MAG TPA: Asp23/Gls24 family envelope stress response protein [Thermoflexales bacterium]|nr:Asp23/Gls24 family envelope stress response protein [Thermoflexales bacterium]HQW36222.1 Asp23/Gls24 family envelope stress response protein [Thermoflexales bacterium]HQZ22447.1 Asp23/Gls24 family envelope stress response protein [Thermoflexales bacterium]HQZ99136.1 Asp23/Gls24 family envelope stress response protein [Thermoflexales bacterium]
MNTISNVSVSPDVIRDVARITTLATPGVLSLVDQPTVISIVPREAFRGVDVMLNDQNAQISLHLIAADDAALMELGKDIQKNVCEAVEEICGVNVSAVNVSFEDVRKA